MMSRARITFRTTFVLVTTVNILVIYSIGRFWMFAVGPYTSRHVSAVGHRLKTSGCTMPQFDPFDPSVSRYFRRARDKRCPGNPDFIYLRWVNTGPSRLRCALFQFLLGIPASRIVQCSVLPTYAAVVALLSA